MVLRSIESCDRIPQPEQPQSFLAADSSFLTHNTGGYIPQSPMDQSALLPYVAAVNLDEIVGETSA